MNRSNPLRAFRARQIQRRFRRYVAAKHARLGAEALARDAEAAAADDAQRSLPAARRRQRRIRAA